MKEPVGPCMRERAWPTYSLSGPKLAHKLWGQVKWVTNPPTSLFVSYNLSLAFGLSLHFLSSLETNPNLCFFYSSYVVLKFLKIVRYFYIQREPCNKSPYTSLCCGIYLVTQLLLVENHEVCPLTHHDSFYDLALLGNEKYFKGSSHFFNFQGLPIMLLLSIEHCFTKVSNDVLLLSQHLH